MFIGFDAKRAFFNHSGLGNYSRDVIRLLCRHFPENTYFLYTPGTGKDIFDNIPGNSHTRTPGTLSGKLFKSYWRSLLVKSQINADKINIYHGLSNELPYKINHAGVKSIVTIHDLIFLRYPEFYKPVDRNIYKKKFSYSCGIADKIVAVSEQTKSDIIHYFGIGEEKVKTVYQTCHGSFKQAASDDLKQLVREKYHLPENYILYVGTIEKRKNLMNICRALHENKIDIPLVAVGKATKYADEVKKYIADNNLDKLISLVHHATLQDLPALYQLSTVFVYPSVFEGFGIPILEALYSGIPVITSKGGCFSEAGGPHSVYTDPENPAEIGEAIRKVLSDEQLRQTMIRNGLQYARNFNEENVAGNLMAVYNSLI